MIPFPVLLRGLVPLVSWFPCLPPGVPGSPPVPRSTGASAAVVSADSRPAVRRGGHAAWPAGATRVEGGKSPKKPAYGGEITLGGNKSFGNTKLSSVNLTARAHWLPDPDYRLTGGFDWFYSQEKDSATGRSRLNQRRVRGFVQADRFLGEKAYLYLREDAQGDAKQKLSLRLVSGAGGGWQVRDDPDLKLSLELGIADTYEDFKGKPADDTVAGRLALKAAKRVTEGVEASLVLEWLKGFDDPDDNLVFGAHAWSFDLGHGMAASFRWEFDYDNTPGSGRERLDHRVLVGVGMKF